MQMSIKRGVTVKLTVKSGDGEAVAASVRAFFRKNLQNVR